MKERIPPHFIRYLTLDRTILPPNEPEVTPVARLTSRSRVKLPVAPVKRPVPPIMVCISTTLRCSSVTALWMRVQYQQHLTASSLTPKRCRAYLPHRSAGAFINAAILLKLGFAAAQFHGCRPWLYDAVSRIRCLVPAQRRFYGSERTRK